MSRHELRCYDYVNHPYASVHDALHGNALKIFKRATSAAAARANDLGVELHARIGAIEVTADVDILITAVEEARSPFGHPATKLELAWKSVRRPGLFPSMTGTLTAYALSPSETQLELFGNYDPPLGVLGDAIDAVAMHKIAEASVLHFVQDVAAYLRTELPQQPGPGATFPIEATD
jgi:hypothetical protein